MTAEELAISALHARAAASMRRVRQRRQPRARRVADVDPARGAVRRRAIRDEPVVLFALEWCEFCWSVRKLFAQLGIAYRNVDLDSVEQQRDDLGDKIRAVLAQRTGGARPSRRSSSAASTWAAARICFDGWRDGSIQRRLAARTASRYDADATVDPDDLLPKWLQPRAAVELQEQPAFQRGETHGFHRHHP